MDGIGREKTNLTYARLDRPFRASSALLSECTHSRASSSVIAGGKNEFIPLQNVGNDKVLRGAGKRTIRLPGMNHGEGNTKLTGAVELSLT
jgi:hypothetical protein